jgi:AraC-like DNA-binding protein
VIVQDHHDAVVVLVEQVACDERALTRAHADADIRCDLHVASSPFAVVSKVRIDPSTGHGLSRQYMDYRVTVCHDEHMATPAAESDPVIVGANWYRFVPGERIAHERVMSACFIWVVRGGGVIRTRDRSFRMDPGMILRLPWQHRVAYEPDDRDPYHLGTLHIVPQHSRADAVVPRVAHLPGDPLLSDPARSGDGHPTPASIASTGSGAGRRIAELGAFAIERFLATPFSEPVFRALAEVVWLENDAWDASTEADRHPVALEQMLAFARQNIARPLAVAEISAAGACSASTAERLFTRHLGMSVGAWMTHHRMNEAALLLRTSGLRVGEVAQRVGFSDALYFSRVFRRTYGLPPRQYASGELPP